MIVVQSPPGPLRRRCGGQEWLFCTVVAVDSAVGLPLI
jgi:hypothetical protein